MYTVWYNLSEGGYAFIFVSDVPTLALAERIARSIMEDFSTVSDAWVEQD